MTLFNKNVRRRRRRRTSLHLTLRATYFTCLFLCFVFVSVFNFIKQIDEFNKLKTYENFIFIQRDQCHCRFSLVSFDRRTTTPIEKTKRKTNNKYIYNTRCHPFSNDERIEQNKKFCLNSSLQSCSPLNEKCKIYKNWPTYENRPFVRSFAHQTKPNHRKNENETWVSYVIN